MELRRSFPIDNVTTPPLRPLARRSLVVAAHRVIQLGAQHGQDAIDQSGHMHLGDADFVGNLLLGCVMKKT